MRDLFKIFRSSGPQSQALHFSYEKAGLTVDNQPIPWNAEAVIIEANVRLSSASARNKADFRLRVGGSGLSYSPEVLRQEPGEPQARLFFRFPVPADSAAIELTWRDRTLGQIALPVVRQGDFLRQLGVQTPTAHVRLGEHTVACQAFVSGQCQGLTFTAMLTSATNLVPLADMNLRLEIRREDGTPVSTVPVRLTTAQLRSRQAVVAVMPPRPRRSGAWVADWRLDDDLLAALRIRAVSKRHFLRSLRVSASRFVVQPVRGEPFAMRTLPPLEGIARVGPCFLLTSGEPGMAGLAQLRVRARSNDLAPMPVMYERETLVTDGPMPLVAPGLSTAALSGLKHFAVESAVGVVGILPLTPIPTATFTSEGGFRPVEDFTWSSAAEEQLNERLGRMLGGG
jgi:hypothetical protein